ncbi:MAG: undecaprenyl-diphosphate phosphatase [Planctomycetota bacterium]|nr:undecaprenyl-diphosphate phosphatase [Planctomycetota bacterium]
MFDSEIFKAVFLGVVQGIAEFLPISSSGHLVISAALLDVINGTDGTNLDDGGIKLNVALHVGTLFSILAIYRRDLIPLLRDVKLVTAIVVATIPIVIVGFTFKDQLKSAFDSPLMAGCGLLITACVLAVGQRLEHGNLELDQFSNQRALIVGVFQAVAILPGISRSGSTISGGMISGLNRDAAAKFSFLIAIPAISGAAVLELKDLFDPSHTDSTSFTALGLGALTAFVVGFFSLNLLLRLVSQGRLHWFVIYCACAGAATIAWQLSA